VVLNPNSNENVSILKNTKHVKKQQVILHNNDNNMDMDEYFILECLKSGPMHIDEIASVCCMEIHNAGSKLFLMELNGLVEQLPGKIFRLKA